jgi:hypothetical protein
MRRISSASLSVRMRSVVVDMKPWSVMAASGGSESWGGWCCDWGLLGGVGSRGEMGEMPPDRRRWMEEVIAVKWPKREEERPWGELGEGVESVDSRRAISAIGKRLERKGKSYNCLNSMYVRGRRSKFEPW